MSYASKLASSLLAVSLAFTAPMAAHAQAQEQFIPLTSYRVGPFGEGGASLFGGMIDYLNLVNAKGGINGVKIVYEECETEYNTSRGVECYERLKSRHGGASLMETGSTGIAYALLDRLPQDKIPMTTVGYGRSDAADGRVFPWVFPLISTYWSQAAVMVKYLGDQVGGLQNLKGKKIVDLYHDSAYGKESFPILDHYAKELGFELIKIPVPTPGIEQQSQWLQIRQARADYVILWGFGVMNAAALRAAARVGFPRDRILGSWWAGSEVDTIPAGDAAKGYLSLSYTAPGSFPVLEEIKRTLYDNGKGNLDRNTLFANVSHVRGIVVGILMTEAIRTAQERYGKGKVVTAEQVRWGYENLNLNEARLKELGAFGLFPTMKTSCEDHEGSGATLVQQWDGTKFVQKTNWLQGDRALVRKLAEQSAAQYAAEKNITLRDCSKEK
jgi:branched-chain amino acid transport system substrate-binding protein